MAGPIERATNLLPQFQQDRTFSYTDAVDGMRQILWGFFKKIVIADQCAVGVNAIFSDYAQASGVDLLMGGLLFTFQIYGDFSGYSDIAIGTGRLFGIRLMQNFRYPYFSRNIRDFWQRWHISLMTWFLDYIYFQLGGSRCSRAKQLRNTFVVFLVSGLWHGANWTFVCWGLYHACLFVPSILRGHKAEEKSLKGILGLVRTGGQMLLTFFLVMLGWILFRSATLTDAAHYLTRMFTTLRPAMPTHGKQVLIYVALMLTVEWWNVIANTRSSFRCVSSMLLSVLCSTMPSSQPSFLLWEQARNLSISSSDFLCSSRSLESLFCARSSCSHRSFSTLCSILCAILSRCCALTHLSTIMLLRPGSISMPTMSVR